MPTDTTTVELVRDGMIAVVRALTPTVDPDQKFELAKDERDFPKWAAKHVPGCYRRFTIREVTDHELPKVSNTLVEFLRAELLLIVAYPAIRVGYWGPDNLRDLDDFVQRDRHQIESALGHRGGANHVTGQCATEAIASKHNKGDPDDKAQFLEITLEAHFFRDFT